MMSRKLSSIKEKKSIYSFPYKSVIISKFLNNLMYDGKKSIAERILLNTFKNLKRITSEDPYKIFTQAIDNTKPLVSLKSIRIGGTNYQVPIETSHKKQLSQAIKFIISSARSRNGHSMEDKLTNEILDCYNNQGISIKKKEEIHKSAEANRAYAHFRW